MSAPLHPIVIQFGRLGDMIVLSSLLHSLHCRYRRPCLVVGAGGWNPQLYAGHPDVARVWSLPRHKPFMLTPTWWNLLWTLHRNSSSPIYVCDPRPRQMARARRLLAISGISPARCVFLTGDTGGDDEHLVDRFVQLGERTPQALRAEDYPQPPGTQVRAPRLRVSDEERAERDEWLKARGWTGRPLVLVQPGNHRSMGSKRERWRRHNADDKAWPIAHWAALLRKVHEQLPQAVIVLCGTSQEAPMLREIQTAAGNRAIEVEPLPLRRLFAVCESAHSMISVDTGPAHAAAALGLPLVVMFGAESQRRWLPRSPCGSAVLGIGGPPISRRVDQISVDEVFDAWRTLSVKTPGVTQQDAASQETSQQGASREDTADSSAANNHVQPSEIARFA